jgi:hypothetical protein
MTEYVMDAASSHVRQVEAQRLREQARTHQQIATTLNKQAGALAAAPSFHIEVGAAGSATTDPDLLRDIGQALGGVANLLDHTEIVLGNDRVAIPADLLQARTQLRTLRRTLQRALDRAQDAAFDDEEPSS